MEIDEFVKYNLDNVYEIFDINRQTEDYLRQIHYQNYVKLYMFGILLTKLLNLNLFQEKLKTFANIVKKFVL